MTTPPTLDDQTRAEFDPTDGHADRLHRVEEEISELRHTVSGLAEIVVGDIRDRRETATANQAAVAVRPIPPSLVSGGPATTATGIAGRRPWLLTDLFREIGTMVRMYADPRYRVRRATQILVPVILALFGVNYLVFHYTLLDVPVFRHILERVADIILAVLLYKVLTREVARYRQTTCQLAGAARSWNPTPMSLLHTDPDSAAVTRDVSP